MSIAESKIASFADVELGATAIAPDANTQWRNMALAERAAAQAQGAAVDLEWETPEGIEVPALFTAEDLDGVDALNSYPGIAPFVRGPYPTMYVNQPWTVRQYAGFSTAEESNRSKRSVRCLRLGNAPRLRLRSSACGGRRRHGRRGHRLDPRHAPTLRRHSA